MTLIQTIASWRGECWGGDIFGEEIFLERRFCGEEIFLERCFREYCPSVDRSVKNWYIASGIELENIKKPQKTIKKTELYAN